jgi:hypothetical protein
VAFAANARAGLGFKIPRGAWRKARKSSRPERRGERLCMRIAQQGMWLEGFHSQTFYDSLRLQRRKAIELVLADISRTRNDILHFFRGGKSVLALHSLGFHHPCHGAEVRADFQLRLRCLAQIYFKADLVVIEHEAYDASRSDKPGRNKGVQN